MKKKVALLSVLMVGLLLSGCSTMSSYQQKKLGQNTKGTLLEGMGATVGVADARAADTVVDRLNGGRSWKSVFGGHVTITPSQALYDERNNRWCRQVIINVDKNRKVVNLCKSTYGAWTKMEQ